MAKGTLTVRVLGDASKFEQTMGGLGKTAGLAFAAVGAAAAAVGVGLFKLGESFDEQFDKIRVGTGATGDALAGLEDSFKNVLRSVPTDFDSAGTAIADLNTRLGLTGEPLEALAGQFLNLSRITKTDVTASIDKATRVFGDWGVAVENQAETLDQLYRAAQSSGIGIDDLSSSLVQFGAPLRNLGFGLEESMALLAQFNKTGVNTEGVVAGLKIGVGQLAKAGEDVPETFRRVVREIEALGPGTEATRKAIELFGQRAGPDLADAIAGGKFSIDEMLASIEGGTDTINQAAKDTESFGEKWSLLVNRVLVALEPVATKVFDAMGTALDRLSDWWAVNGPGIMLRVGEVRDAILGFVERVSGGIQAIVDAWNEAGFSGALAELGNQVSGAWDTYIYPGFVALGGAIQGWFEGLWGNHIRPGLESAWASFEAWLNNDGPQRLGENMAAMALALTDWITTEAIPLAEQKLSEFIAAMAAWAEGDGWKRILGVGLKLTAGILAGVGMITLFASKIALDIITALAKAAWEIQKQVVAIGVEIGRKIAQGIVSGLSSGKDMVGDAIANMLPGGSQGNLGKAFGWGRAALELGIPWADNGGIANWTRGEHRPVMVAGGETLIPTHKDGFGMGPSSQTTYNLTFEVSPTADRASLGREVVEVIQAYERDRGSAWRAS